MRPSPAALVGTQPGLVWATQPTRHTDQLLGDLLSPRDLSSSSFSVINCTRGAKAGWDASSYRLLHGCSCRPWLLAAEVKVEPSAPKGRGRTVKHGRGFKVGALTKGARWALGFGKT